MLKLEIRNRKKGLKINKSTEGESIETKIERMMNNGEGVDSKVELIYTDRKEGVLPSYDMRHDKWETALDGMTKIQKTESYRIANKEKVEETTEKKEDGKPEPTQATQKTE